jgi:hypothetical protein
MGDSRGAAVRPATAAGCLRPWMPTGSTKVEPLQSFGRLESPKNPWIPWVFDDEILWWMEILHQLMEGLSQLIPLFTV